MRPLPGGVLLELRLHRRLRSENAASGVLRPSPDQQHPSRSETGPPLLVERHRAALIQHRYHGSGRPDLRRRRRVVLVCSSSIHIAMHTCSARAQAEAWRAHEAEGIASLRHAPCCCRHVQRRVLSSAQRTRRSSTGHLSGVGSRRSRAQCAATRAKLCRPCWALQPDVSRRRKVAQARQEVIESGVTAIAC